MVLTTLAALDQMLKDAVRRRFDVCLVWFMGRPWAWFK
jgi:hypothetical protein